jgi:FKBP-type peptidyl-prolyl cis-trans isomerase
MRKMRYIMFICFVFFVFGCQSGAINNIKKDYDFSKDTNKSIVIGKIDYGIGGVVVTSYELLIKNISTGKYCAGKTCTSFPIGDYFFVAFDAGNYCIEKFIFDTGLGGAISSKIVGYYAQSVPVNVCFEVKANEITYIGNLFISARYAPLFNEVKYIDSNINVGDNYYEATGEFEKKYPSSGKKVVKRLMMSALQKQMVDNKALVLKSLAEKNKEEGEGFLSINRDKEGVITLPSGLQYKVINTGKGKIPYLTDRVEVNYRGTLINGTEFDSTYKRGQMANFTVNQVIPGWIEALLKMREGDKWQLFIPPHLAYGERGAGRAIEPNATLIFEVELISVK